MVLKKIIIDTDPGIDDALAIMYAMKHPEIEILGITTVAGNKGLKTTTNNATKLSKYFGSKVKVYRGAHAKLDEIDKPEIDSNLTKDIHGVDGLGGVNLEKDDSLIQEKSAYDFILETINKYPNEVDIITLGPLTNLAICIEKDLETMKKVKSIHSMGGGVFSGNVSPVAEFNYWFDAKSVDIVYGKLGEYVPIYMVGLDVTRQGLIDFNDLKYMELVGGDLGKLVNDLVKDYINSYWKNNRVFGIVIHDLVAMVGYANNEIYKKVYNANLRCVYDSDVAYGQCIVDLVDSWKLPKNAYIPMEMDFKLYKYEINKVLFGESEAKEYRKIIGG